MTDKWEGDWASTDFTSGRIVFSLLFPLSLFSLLCVWLCSCVHSFSWCKTQIDPQPPRWQPTSTPPPRKRTQECHQKQMTFLLLFRANSRFIIGQVSDRFGGETKVLSPARVADGRVVLLWLYSASFRSERQLGNCRSLASAPRSSQTKHVAETEADCCRD